MNSDSPISNRLGDANLLVGMNWRTHAAAAAFSGSSQGFEHARPQSDCIAVGDGVFIYTVIINVPLSLDPDNNGIVDNYSGYTDPDGNISTQSTAVPARAQPVCHCACKMWLWAPISTTWQQPYPGICVLGDGVVTHGVRRFDITPADYRCPSNPTKRCSWVHCHPVTASLEQYYAQFIPKPESSK